MKTLFFKRGIKGVVSLALALAILLSFAVPSMAATVRIASVSLSPARNVITMYMSETVAVADGVDLPSMILLSRDGGSLEALPFGSTAAVDGSKIVINLTSALNAAKNYITIQSGALDGQIVNITSPNIDAAGPSLLDDGVSIDSSRTKVTLKFDSDILGGLGTEEMQEGSVKLARNGSSFNETISKSAMTLDSAAGTITIRLSSALSGNSARFKIFAGEVQKKSNGNVNIQDIITPAIAADVAIPEIDQSAPLGLTSDCTTFTLTFNTNIKYANDSYKTDFRNRIFISREGAEYYPLNTRDIVTISGNKMTIQLYYELTGNNNKIKILSGTLASTAGDVALVDLYSPWIDISDLKYNAPMYSSVSYNKANKQVSIKFNEDIVAVSRNSLATGVLVSRNKGEFEALSTYDTVEIINSNTILVTLDQGLTGEYNRLRVLGGTVKSTSNHIQTYPQTTSYIDLSAEMYEDFECEISMSADMMTADIIFDRYIQSNYPYDEDLDFLKQEIRVMRASTSNAYNELTDYDSVTISGRTLRIRFQRALGENDIIRITKYALKDSYGTIMQSEIRIGPSYNTDGEMFNPETGTELSADKKTVTFNFNAKVYNNMSSTESLKYMIRVAYDGETFEDLGENCSIKFLSAGLLSITFDRSLTNPEARVKILAGALKDENGKTISEDIVTNPLGQTDSSVSVLIGGQSVYVASQDSSPDSSGNTIYVATINSTKLASTLATYTGLKTFAVNLPEYAYGGKMKINGAALAQLINKGFEISVSCGGVTQTFDGDEIGLSEALSHFGLNQNSAQSVVLEVGISKVGNPYSATFEAKATQKTFKILSQATELSVTYTYGNTNYAITKYDDYVTRTFKVKPSDVQNRNVTVLRIEGSGKVNPVPTKIISSGGNYYLEAKVKNSGVYGVISAERYFTDTPTWAQNAVNTLASRMILQNANAGAFRASDAITRAEVSEMVTRALGILTDRSGASKFLDVTLTDWYFPSTSIANECDIIRGYEDSTFRPERNITRQEAMAIMSRVMSYLGDTENSNMTTAQAEQILSRFKDGSRVANWAKIDMAKCVQAGVVKGDDKGYLNPYSNLTRAEMSQLIYNLLIEYNLIQA